MRLREIRLRKGLTQVQLGDLAGLSQPVIAAIETRKVGNPNWNTVCRLAYALGEFPEAIFPIPLEFQKKAKAMLRGRKNGRKRKQAA